MAIGRIRPALLSLLVAVGATVGHASCPAPLQAGGVDIYPTSQELPANLLRIYVYFPRPMTFDGILDSVRLLDASGTPVEGAFLRNRVDLWSSDRRRLTVFLDPARVKTGLAAHDKMGRALLEGKRHTIEVRGTAKDINGCSIGADTVHVFTAAAPDLEPPAPNTWHLTVPAAGSTDTIEVDLGTPHDHLSLAYRLRVIDRAGHIIPGAIALMNEERGWRFTPSSPWSKQVYSIAIDPRLEDLAGNRPGRLFDQPIGQVEATPVNSITFQPSSIHQ